MTETCAAATLNTPGAVRFGTVGRPLAGTEVAIADGRRDPDGAARTCSPATTATRRRRARPCATAGCARATSARSTRTASCTSPGRKKDLIITSSGKNISPENIESALRETRWISQAVVVGDRRSYLVALLTLDPDEAPKLAAELGIRGDLATHGAPTRASARRSSGGRRRGQRALRADRADQALRHPRARPLAGGGRADADAEGQAALIYRAYADRFARLYEN